MIITNNDFEISKILYYIEYWNEDKTQREVAAIYSHNEGRAIGVVIRSTIGKDNVGTKFDEPLYFLQLAYRDRIVDFTKEYPEENHKEFTFKSFDAFLDELEDL